MLLRTIATFKKSLYALLLAGLFLLPACRQALEPGKEATSTPRLSQAVDQAYLKAANGGWAQSLADVDSAYAHSSYVTVADRFNYYFFRCDICMRHLRDYPQAIRYADSMQLLLESSKMTRYLPALHAKAYYAKGDAFLAIGDYDEAYRNFFTGSKIAKGAVDSCVLSEFSYRFGMVCYKQEKYAEATASFLESYSESQACDDRYYYRRQELLSNAGLCYLRREMPDSALFYFRLAATVIDTYGKKFPEWKLNNRLAIGVLYGNMAEAYRQQNKTDTAEQLLKQSIAINADAGNERVDGQKARLALVRLYLSSGRMAPILPLLREVEHTLDTLHDREIRLLWLEQLWQYHQAAGEDGLALKYLLQYKHLHDSLADDNRNIKDHEIRGQMAHLEERHQLALLQKTNENHRRILWMSAGLFLILLALFAVIVFNYRRSRRNVQLLTRLNEKIEAQKKQLEQTLQKLHERDKEKNRMLRIVAHDLRNPIAGIASIAGLLMDDPTDEQEREELLKLVENACANSLDLINELLLATELQQPSAVRSHHNVNAIVKSVADIFRFKAAEKRQTIRLQLLPGQCLIWCNREKIWRALSNLVTNAIKFSREETEIRIGVERNGNCVLISVRDEGIGIPESLHARVFDVFTTAKRRGTAAEKTFGLGLSISKQIIEEHRGRIWFESREGQGSVFYIELPVTADVSDPVGGSDVPVVYF